MPAWLLDILSIRFTSDAPGLNRGLEKWWLVELGSTQTDARDSFEQYFGWFVIHLSFNWSLFDVIIGFIFTFGCIASHFISPQLRTSSEQFHSFTDYLYKEIDNWASSSHLDLLWFLNQDVYSTSLSSLIENANYLFR